MAKKMLVNARSAAAIIVQQVLVDGAYTNIAVNKFLRNNPLDDLERRLLTELVYGTIKAVGTIDWYLQQCVTRPLDKIEKEILSVLRISAYQLLYMDRIPDSAACNEAVKLARSLSNEGSAKFVNAVLRSLLRKQAAGEFKFPDAEEDDAGYLSLEYFHPRWLIKRWLGPYGREGVEKLLQFDNTPAPVCMRTNTLTTTRQQLLSDLEEAGAECHASKWSEDGIVCDRMPSLSSVFAKLENAFYVQDESSMLVGSVVGAEPGMRVLDMCSAPGGKTTHVAQLMENKGEIIACDVHEHKLKLIAENAERLNISIIKPQLSDGTIFKPEWGKSFDRVLVDAPCSGLGVLRRRAEARWRKKRNELKLFPPLQLKILRNACRYVKDGGRLIYSTCTIEQAENHYLVEEFLQAKPEWQRVPFKHPLTGELVDELQLLPQNDGTDGFYICVLEKRQSE